MPRFLERLFARAALWLHRSEPPAPLQSEPIPFPIEKRMARLGLESRARGRGSDLAAAELRGMQTVILAVRQTSHGWRGTAARRG